MPPDTPPLFCVTPPPAIDLVAEGLINLAEAAGDFRDAHGKKPHIASLRRWAKNGCRGHKLETVFVGGRLLTSHRATARFLAALNGQPVPSHALRATSATERAGKELDVLLR